MAAAAKRALQWMEEGYAGSGFTDVGRKRASQLAGREAVSLETVKRMHSFFSRHEVDKKGKDFDNMDNPSPGRVAWDAWGGDAGQRWAAQIVETRSDKTMSSTNIFARIIKADKQADGSLLVTGIATDSSLDSDEQVCDPVWLKAAMPAWFRWGNIREQHSNIAAGVATEYENKDGQHWITARVVAAESVKKVEAGVLKGFSIGIRQPRVVRDDKAAGGRIVDGEIVEVSLVDRPANPICTLSLAKAVNGVMVPDEQLMEKTVDETTSEQTAEESTVEETVEETAAEKAVAEESTEASAAPKAAEESSQAPGEESSQAVGEESSREGGVAGVAGKGEEWNGLHKRLDVIEQMCKSMYDKMCGDEGKSATEDIRKAVNEVEARMSVLEKNAQTVTAPVRTVVPTATPVPNETAVKAKEYRAKAMAATNPQLAQGYLTLALELEKSL